MNRRDLIAGLGALAVLRASPVQAQSPTAPRRIAFLNPSTEQFARPMIDAFTARLKDLEYVAGRDYVIDIRWAEGRYERFEPLARELLALRPAVIVASTGAAARAFKQLTETLPIVFISSIDPIADGFVESLARPGRNMTGTTYRGPAMVDKTIEMLREIMPGASRVAMLVQRDQPNVQSLHAFYRKGLSARGFEVEFFSVGLPGEFDEAFARIVRTKPAALVAHSAPFFVSHARRICDLALKARLPVVGFRRAFSDAGGLLSYDNDIRDDYRRAAVFVDKIFKGAKPADMPVEQPDVYEMVVNLRTANALGLKIPQSALLRATEVIE